MNNIEAFETNKALSNVKVAKKGEKVFAQNSTTNKVEDTQTQTLTQSIKKNTEENQEKIIEQLQQATDELNEQMDKLNTNIAFAFSDETERLYIQVLEKDTGKLIREFPSEKARALAGYLKNAVGLLFDKES